MKPLPRTWALGLLAAALMTALPGVAQAQTTVFPGSPLWEADQRGAGVVGITGTAPRSGNGSLELSLNGSLTDWAFFRRTAGDSLSSSWGFLAAVTTLTFEWQRQALASPTTDIPWEAQSPVLRLFLRQGSGLNAVFSELVWEKFYTDNSPAVTNTWVTQNTLDQMFWHYVQGASGGYTIGDCSNIDPFFPNPLKTATPSTWANGNNCLPTDVAVWGVSVGVGSNWPHQYRGFVDNVQLGFGGDALVVNDNFELPETPVPEPATFVLMGSGLLGLAGARWMRRRKASGR